MMSTFERLFLVILWTPTASAALGAEPVLAVVESSMPTHDRQIRQFVLDGDDSSFFASDKAPTAEDHLTITLQRPVSLRSIAVKTGRPDGTDKFAGGSLEISEDGKTFRRLSAFDQNGAHGGPANEPVRAVRIKPEAATKPIAIREVVITSEPPVATFKYPVEFVLDVSDAPDLKEWAEGVVRTCEQAYPMINEELPSNDFKPPRVIRLTLSKNYKGVAAASRGRIVGAVDYFRRRPKDVGAFVHETVHIVQSYPGRNNPSWLVEGVADYIRFFKYEPGKLGRIDPKSAHYDNSYRVSAAFLAYLVEKYDKQIVRKLNAALRERRYEDNMIHEITGKFLGELDDEWRATLRR
jgi:hypothetical protein